MIPTVLALGVLLDASCLDTATKLCADGLRCPAGYTCIQADIGWTCIEASICGDMSISLSAGEVCDDGNLINGDGCSSTCRSDESCGNRIVDMVKGEECDDGEESSSCDSDCSLARCGDGYTNISAGEECDDRNRYDLDSCSSACQVRLQVAAGAFHTCALQGTGAIRCWGQGDDGRLGYGNLDAIGDDELPARAGNVQFGDAAIQLVAGSFHTCALADTGAVRCWGLGDGGRLGYGNTDSIGDDESPADADDVNVGGSVVQLAAGAYHTCALLDTGAVRCWGLADDGRLGYGNIDTIGDDESPASAGDVAIGDPGDTVVQLVAGYDHTCALQRSGAVRCWGAGSFGRLGYGNTDNIGDDETPASAGDVDVGGAVAQLSASGFHTCALLSTRAVRCWGLADRGQLGYGNTDNIGDDETPASAGDVDVGGAVAQLSAGAYHTCAISGTGAVRCWGAGDHGQLGYGNTDSIGDDELPSTAGEVSYR